MSVALTCSALQVLHHRPQAKLSGFGPVEPHEFCIGGVVKCRACSALLEWVVLASCWHGSVKPRARARKPGPLWR
jgi:hypothetical protein